MAHPRHAARVAELVYVSDHEPGIRRSRHGRGHRYVNAHGNAVRAPADVQRIKTLAVPPAWTDVWIASDPDAHIQATGRDQKGRKQYRYHPAWIACRDEAKFSTLAAFGRKLPLLRQQVERDLHCGGMDRRHITASVVALLDDTMIRIGSDAYARENRSFGLSTLRRRHLQINGTELRFCFVGKSGQEWKVKLRDRRLASILRSLQELPGQRLFQYVDEDGTRHPIRSQDVNAYIQETIGPEYTSKHFRTWGATRAAAFALATMPLPETKRESARLLNACIDKVASRLHNTRSVCRRCYIHPRVPESWLAGQLEDELAELFRQGGRPPKGLEREEVVLLNWLDR